MKIVIAVIIYNRIKNLEAWIQCWQQSEIDNAELRIIHNVDNLIIDNEYSRLCKENNITYIQRRNIGQDIGALQDVCRGRLVGFDNEYDYMLWCTDDTIPMRKTFVKEYLGVLQSPNCDAACLEISEEVVTHIRTSGIMAKKELWQSLEFPADPMTMLHQNYFFEHLGKEKTMLKQIEAQEKYANQPWPLHEAPLWDIDKREQLHRWPEHYGNFNRSGKAIVISTAYQRHPVIVSSMLAQTYPNWELVLIHDGINHTGMFNYIDNLKDNRIRYIEFKDRQEKWGHPLRQWALNEIKNGSIVGEYVTITNEDNYHVPTYLEQLIKALEKDLSKVAAYCGMMIHNYTSPKYTPIPARTERGFIDCASVMIRAKQAAEIGWNDLSIYSDWTYFQEVANKNGGFGNWVMVPGCLLVHN